MFEEEILSELRQYVRALLEEQAGDRALNTAQGTFTELIAGAVAMGASGDDESVLSKLPAPATAEDFNNSRQVLGARAERLRPLAISMGKHLMTMAQNAADGNVNIEWIGYSGKGETTGDLRILSPDGNIDISCKTSTRGAVSSAAASAVNLGFSRLMPDVYKAVGAKMRAVVTDVYGGSTPRGYGADPTLKNQARDEAHKAGAVMLVELLTDDNIRKLLTKAVSQQDGAIVLSQDGVVPKPGIGIFAAALAEKGKDFTAKDMGKSVRVFGPDGSAIARFQGPRFRSSSKSLSISLDIYPIDSAPKGPTAESLIRESLLTEDLIREYIREAILTEAFTKTDEKAIEVMARKQIDKKWKEHEKKIDKMFDERDKTLFRNDAFYKVIARIYQELQRAYAEDQFKYATRYTRKDIPLARFRPS